MVQNLILRKTKTTWFEEAVTVFKHKRVCKAHPMCLQIRSRERGTFWTFLASLRSHLRLPSESSSEYNQEIGVLGLHRTQRWILSTWLLAAGAPVARRGFRCLCVVATAEFLPELRIVNRLLSSCFSACCTRARRETERPPRAFRKERGATHTLPRNRTPRSRRKKMGK